MIEIEYRPIKLRPESWARRAFYERSPFDSTHTQTMRLLERELSFLNAKQVVMQLDAKPSQFTRDGRLRADARIPDPGVILSFDTPEHGTLTYDTDRFVTWQDNLRAIALGLESLRRVERYGIADRGQQYAGYRELGSGIALGPTKLTAPVAASLIADATGITELSGTDVIVNWCHKEHRTLWWRDVSKRHHPDHGGDHETFARLVEARDVLDAACKVTER